MCHILFFFQLSFLFCHGVPLFFFLLLFTCSVACYPTFSTCINTKHPRPMPSTPMLCQPYYTMPTPPASLSLLIDLPPGRSIYTLYRRVSQVLKTIPRVRYLMATFLFYYYRRPGLFPRAFPSFFGCSLLPTLPVITHLPQKVT